MLRQLWLLPRTLLLGLVRGYRLLLKPWLGNACRFEPSCSQYALTALQQHGAAVGAGLTTYRVLRCHPWCDGGFDPVPSHLHWPASQGLFSRLVLPARRTFDTTIDVAGSGLEAHPAPPAAYRPDYREPAP